MRVGRSDLGGEVCGLRVGRSVGGEVCGLCGWEGLWVGRFVA